MKDIPGPESIDLMVPLTIAALRSTTNSWPSALINLTVPVTSGSLLSAMEKTQQTKKAFAEAKRGKTERSLIGQCASITHDDWLMLRAQQFALNRCHASYGVFQYWLKFEKLCN